MSPTGTQDMRYQSIAVHDIRQVDQFAAHLRWEQARTHKAPIVRHLFISAPNWGEVDLASWAEDERVPRVRGALVSLQHQWSTRLMAATGDLLQMVAPTLQTLFLHGNTLNIAAPGRVEFPILTTLSISRDPFWDSTDPILPALRRLHITTFNGDTRPFWDRLAILVPANSLTHLRLSGVEARDVEDLEMVHGQSLKLEVSYSHDTVEMLAGFTITTREYWDDALLYLTFNIIACYHV
ncbi:hypothetical protein PUNSTDRAFT_131962 [Punctularia strigosozonata HHB-11173 SS5]|uniref:uncharacterized protein n=1 Tax=Punctularia strigosozonata (strain HHB-11173) TaxID=741275 RepID=UPI0004417129|nr:uncharacterized protein PUNSTDRAFT_131962 [Punctularia strigosozonata HHB-11173 SS5]EIN11807.1 hypothetical protein PUNSTDRAFT_131962 [Punctularia strigosozonata HHB-11173 SS5]